MYGCKGSYEDIELKYWDGSLLSLELTVSRPDGEIYRDVYYFDFADETRLSAEDVLARMGLSWESLTPALIRTAVRAHDRVMQAQNGPFTSALAADALALRAQTVLAAQDARLPFYPNGDGTLTVWLNLAAGADSMLGGACTVVETAVSTVGLPQATQNLAPSFRGAPQVQRFTSGSSALPQATQNFAPAFRGVPQYLQKFATKPPPCMIFVL